MLSSLAMTMLIVFYIFNSDLQTALLIPSGAAIIVYIIGSLSGIKLLHKSGWRRSLPWFALVISVVALPFVGPLIIPAVIVSLAGFGYGFKLRKRWIITEQE